MKRKKNLKKLLNLGILDYTNLTTKIGELDMPYVVCNVVPEIDYIALYGQPSTYCKTENTAVAFFEYDIVFDGLYGLYNGIRYEVKEIQDFYIERFRNVKYFIGPDYSKCGDIPEEENIYRQFMSRIVCIWLSMNTNAVVVPFVSCGTYRQMNYMLDGMEDCIVVAMNLKGPMGDPKQLIIFIEMVAYTVDHLPKLQCIIVYTTSTNTQKIQDVIRYATDKGIRILIPDNMLLSRNKSLKGGKSDGINK
ncbi:MAG: DUF4417 domain-containing protein [Erysipelotrichaceae bacterium]|nr:DUF4417 domain-containing protein [Erysipelotrichaceae bacterium]